MKRSISIQFLLGLLFLIGCSNDNNTFEDITDRGGFVSFNQTPELSYSVLRLDSDIISAQLVDSNGNADSYSLSVTYGDATAENIITVTEFPYQLELPISDIIDALGLTEEDIELGSTMSFVGTVTSPNGTYSGASPDLNDNNVNEGGDTTDRSKLYFPNQAMEFSISFFQPAGKTIRATSFEEVPIGAEDDTYDRNGSNDETLDLINGDVPPYVDYVAAGNGVDDELGFDAEYIAITDISSSSLGFSAERIGVFSLFEDYEAYPDGTQGFHSEDADGAIRLTFDTVEVPEGQENSGVSFQVYFGDTSWESLDGIHAYANITTDSGAEVLELASIYSDDIEEVAGQWYEINSGYLRGVRSYELVIQIQSGATSESFDIDNVIIYESED
ncbi:hypothetical protein [Flagellimonas oceanensis]|uniref:hypothetical protein n=1 Tax=Flagellimonas oceanensis TaxID=2499163 RepID=UPI000F8E4395|nr:hypothetical protein [Allomuricauda oceanensis]|tara:strand:+ start:1641 stop:2804 length:1164 start_codon:yes stop_codon:yes gene_type:complete